jgi:hypothetical protein
VTFRDYMLANHPDLVAAAKTQAWWARMAVGLAVIGGLHIIAWINKGNND